MLTEQRHRIILQQLESDGAVSINDLKRMLKSSESTIRRDINFLHDEGKLNKVFGGAVAREADIATTELSVTEKSEVNVPEKMRIARYAATLVKPREFVYIDAGTTTEYMADYISERDATYVTNAIGLARKLAVSGFKVILIGGELKGLTEAVVGTQAIVMLEGMNFNKGFFGTNGISSKRGFTTPDMNEAYVKEMAFNHSRERFVLADESKFGSISPITFASLGDAMIITGKAPQGGFDALENIVVVDG
jgi:DeoR family fructose operon transcriptional repressor